MGLHHSLPQFQRWNDAQNPFLTNAGAAVWGDAATFIPYTLYRHFRDKGLLKQYIELMTD